MEHHCKDFSRKLLFYLLCISLIVMLNNCQQPKQKPNYTPIKERKEIVINSSMINGIGPIPEWVLNLESSEEIQKSKDGVFFVFMIESEKIEDFDGKLKFLNYLSKYLPDAKELSSILALTKNGNYWHKLKNGKYQNFFRYEITKESINEASKRKNTFSEKTKLLIEELSK
ncbi:MAG: hypothetical protein ACK4F9_03605 [Brevinematia bacterium]